MEVLTKEIIDAEAENLTENLNESFNCRVKYSDKYYKNYIKNFTPNNKKRIAYKFIKRAFDLIASLLMLIILSPLFLIVAIAIKIDSKGPVFFKQKRVGKNAKTFNCYKFRSMKIDAPHDCPTSLMVDPEKYQTKVGRFLRKTSIDELPQLWCVFIGTMSFIGYRPLILSEENCNEMRKELNVFSLKPGISGYAQVHGRDNVYYKNKAILDAEYVKIASVWLDIKLMFQTVAVVLKRKGNNDNTSAQNVEIVTGDISATPIEEAAVTVDEDVVAVDEVVTPSESVSAIEEVAVTATESEVNVVPSEEEPLKITEETAANFKNEQSEKAV